MNTEKIALPEISDRRIDEIETALMGRIAAERADASDQARRRAVRRGRVWMAAAAAAAVVAVAGVIGPQLTGPVTTADGPAAVTARDAAASGDSAEQMSAPMTAQDGAGGAAAESARSVIVNASATVEVKDARTAADAITAAATRAGGYVESLSIGTSQAGSPDIRGIEPAYPPAGAWITVRVPAATLDQTMADLAKVGTVTFSQVGNYDVTTDVVDLDARITALKTSVDRLTELVGQSSSTADLIAAESALAERQAELTSLEQQREHLGSQVDLATLSVNLVEPAPAVTANPTGFADGVVAGWNGLIAALNGIVVGVGFLLPWIGVLGILGLIVWAIVRVVRRRRTPRE